MRPGHQAGVRLRRVGGDAGTVTAELALGLVAVVLVLAVLLLTASASSLQVRCVDAARAGARVAALGQSDGEAAAAARQLAPGAVVRVRRDPPWVEVSVTRALAGSWFTSALAVSGSATAWLEP